MWFYDGSKVSELYGIAKYGWTRPRPALQDVASRGLNNPTRGPCGGAHMHRRCRVDIEYIYNFSLIPVEHVSPSPPSSAFIQFIRPIDRPPGHPEKEGQEHREAGS